MGKGGCTLSSREGELYTPLHGGAAIDQRKSNGGGDSLFCLGGGGLRGRGGACTPRSTRLQVISKNSELNKNVSLLTDGRTNISENITFATIPLYIYIRKGKNPPFHKKKRILLCDRNKLLFHIGYMTVGPECCNVYPSIGIVQ